MKFKLVEAYKDRKFIEDAFKDAVYETIPNKNAADKMINSKLALMDDFDWEALEQYVNDLEFPLVVFRGLKANSKDEVDVTPGNLGINWTIDPDLYFDSTSNFNDLDYVVIGEISEDQVDWPNTIQNYIYYSLKSDLINIYPETEVTIKENSNIRRLKVVSMDELAELLEG